MKLMRKQSWSATLGYKPKHWTKTETPRGWRFLGMGPHAGTPLTREGIYFYWRDTGGRIQMCLIQ